MILIDVHVVKSLFIFFILQFPFRNDDKSMVFKTKKKNFSFLADLLWCVKTLFELSLYRGLILRFLGELT